MSDKKIIGFPHSPQSHGGPGSFQMRLEKRLKSLGWQVVYPEDDISPDCILVVGGTKKLKWLKKCKKKGTKIVHRLDGINWQHKILPCSIKEKLLASARNYLFKKIRNHLADEIIYQSNFIKECWHNFSGQVGVPEHVIYNAVDLSNYDLKMKEKPDLICVEGTIQPHPASIEPLIKISSFLIERGLINEVTICGNMSEKVKCKLSEFSYFNIKGCVPRSEIPQLLSGNLYLVLEINPPCPNSVIEALASGCPVIGFNSGALSELVDAKSGLIVDYSGNPWEMNIPDTSLLLNSLNDLFLNFDRYSKSAKQRAIEKFDINCMADKYIEILSR